MFLLWGGEDWHISEAVGRPARMGGEVGEGATHRSGGHKGSGCMRGKVEWCS